MPHILNLYGSRATARDFEIYAADASFEDPLSCTHGVKQIKSAFDSLSKVFSESSIVEYNIKQKIESQGKYEILIDNKQSYKFMGRYIDMISLIWLHVVDGKVIRHEDCIWEIGEVMYIYWQPCLKGKNLSLSVRIGPLSPGEASNVPSEVVVKAGAVLNFSVRWYKKPLKNRDTVDDFPLVGRLIEAARRDSMMVTHAMMGFGKDPSA